MDCLAKLSSLLSKKKSLGPCLMPEESEKGLSQLRHAVLSYINLLMPKSHVGPGALKLDQQRDPTFLARKDNAHHLSYSTLVLQSFKEP
jgi:hypothetical protein